MRPFVLCFVSFCKVSLLKVTFFFCFILSKLSLSIPKLGSQVVPAIIPFWLFWVKLPKLNPIVIVCSPKVVKLDASPCWSELLKPVSTVWAKLSKLNLSRSEPLKLDSGFSLSRSKLFKPDSRLSLLRSKLRKLDSWLFVLLSLLLLLFWLLVLLWCCCRCCCCCCCCCCCSAFCLLKLCPASCCTVFAECAISALS